MEKWKKYLVPVVICLLSNVMVAQKADSLKLTEVADIQIDTIKPDSLSKVAAALGSLSGDSAQALKKERFFYKVFKKDYPNPKMALYLSLAVPGGGQIYNKRWWKLPFVYGAYAGLVYAIDYNTGWYRRFKNAYIAELRDSIHEFSNTRLQADDLKRLRDKFDKNKQLSYIGLVAVHLIQGAEAFVDCHLKTFDVGDDLSLKLKPTFNWLESGESVVGLGLSLQIGRSSVFERNGRHFKPLGL
jgi:hypothetical protein